MPDKNKDKEKKVPEKDTTDNWYKQIRWDPERRWETVQELGNNNGGMNGGIAVVCESKSETKTQYIEKRAKKRELDAGMVEQEIRILKWFSKPPHPFIISIVDHFVDKKKGKASIYLDKCDNGGLDGFIDKRRSNEAEFYNEIDVWEWFIQLFDALAYMHYGKKREADDSKVERWNAVRLARS
jgi:serine/threonine protein kinase